MHSLHRHRLMQGNCRDQRFLSKSVNTPDGQSMYCEPTTATAVGWVMGTPSPNKRSKSERFFSCWLRRSGIQPAASNPNGKAIRLLISFGNTQRRHSSNRWGSCAASLPHLVVDGRYAGCLERIHITKGALAHDPGPSDALLCETVNGPQRTHNSKTQPEVSITTQTIDNQSVTHVSPKGNNSSHPASRRRSTSDRSCLRRFRLTPKSDSPRRDSDLSSTAPPC